MKLHEIIPLWDEPISPAIGFFKGANINYHLQIPQNFEILMAKISHNSEIMINFAIADSLQKPGQGFGECRKT